MLFSVDKELSRDQTKLLVSKYKKDRFCKKMQRIFSCHFFS